MLLCYVIETKNELYIKISQLDEQLFPLVFIIHAAMPLRPKFNSKSSQSLSKCKVMESLIPIENCVVQRNLLIFFVSTIWLMERKLFAIQCKKKT